MRSLYWLRSDLRTRDNPALFEAVRRGENGCLAVFVITPAHWATLGWGSAKVDFLLRSLERLSPSLLASGVPLLIRECQGPGDLPLVLEEVAKKHGCDSLFFNAEPGVDARRRDDAVAARFADLSLPTYRFDDQTILPPESVRTGSGGFYRVFGPFRRRWLRELWDRGLPELLPAPTGAAPSAATSGDPIPHRITGFAESRPLARLWPAGEAEAEVRLARFLREGAGAYADGRDRPAADLTSRLSPYLSLGVISARCCLAAAMAANDGRIEDGRPGVDAWITELVWREFYRHVLVGFPRVAMGRAFRTETESVRWTAADERFVAWCEGRTGVPLVDAGMRQLAETAWMHNRLRMVTAMFLTKDLLVDWREGERFFMRSLIDGDLASNNGGWQWASSTGTDAAPYFRIFNPWTQAGRFDPEATFIKTFVPELRSLEAPIIHSPRRLAQARDRGLDYPPPLVDHPSARRRAIAAFRAAAGEGAPQSLS